MIKARDGDTTPVRAWSVRIKRSRARSNCATWNSCVKTPTARPRSPCPGRSPCRQQAKNEFYKDEEELAMAFAEAVNAEARDCKTPAPT